MGLSVTRRLAAGHPPWPLVQVQVKSQACTLQQTHNKQLKKLANLYFATAREDSFPFFTFQRTCFEDGQPPFEATSAAQPALKRQLSRRLAILPRVRRPIVHASGKIAKDRLPAAHPAGKSSQHLNLMPLGCQLVAHFSVEPILHLHVAPSERIFREPRRLHRSLNVHLEIRNVRDELRVRLRLVPPTHNSKRHSLVTILREPRNNRMPRPLVSRQRIRRRWIKREQSPAIVQHKSRPRRNNPRPKRRVIALNERHHVSI